MKPSHIKIILAILAALGIGTGGTLLTSGGGGGISLDPEKVGDLGKKPSLGGHTTTALNCDRLSHWKKVNGTRINQAHIFCGEWDDRKDRAKGFHSRPNGRNPSSVGSLEVTERQNRDGVYGVRWVYAGEGGKAKFSTMFPDSCGVPQVLASVSFAASNRKKCPSGAPRWAWCGTSAPRSDSKSDSNEFCTGAGGKAFTIAGGSLDDGSVNTAFPLR